VPEELVEVAALGIRLASDDGGVLRGGDGAFLRLAINAGRRNRFLRQVFIGWSLAMGFVFGRVGYRCRKPLLHYRGKRERLSGIRGRTPLRYVLMACADAVDTNAKGWTIAESRFHRRLSQHPTRHIIPGTIRFAG
jgi:hypothetical protein